MRTNVWPGILKGRELLEDLGIDERIVLKWILVKKIMQLTVT
jgi:hypothetical protein